MHPRVRDVRRPDAGIDPRGSGDGRAPLLQGHLKRHKGGGGPLADPSEAAAPEATSAEKPSATLKPAAKPAAKRAAAKPAAKRPAAKPRPKAVP